MKLKSIREAAVKGKRVLVRVDFNLPLDEKGEVTDTTRIEESLPTLRHLATHGARIILMSHLGRPDPKNPDPHLKMDKIAQAFSKLWGTEIQKADDCIGPKVEEKAKTLREGEVLLLENTRFHAEEEKNNPKFSEQLAQLGDLFVNDAFGAAHRAHASTVGVTHHLPSYAGLLLEKEITALSPLLKNPQHPLIMIIGGAKIDTKIGILKNFVDKADTFLMGGALANTFLSAAGHQVGASLYEKNKIKIAQEIMLACESHQDRFLIPVDVIVADEISQNAQIVDIPVEDVEGQMKILDIGTQTLQRYLKVIAYAKTIIWNGPVGLYEYPPFARGTQEIARALAQSNATTILGGGDTIDAIKKFGHSFEEFTHISTGGGAMLEFLEGKSLQGIAVLTK